MLIEDLLAQLNLTLERIAAAEEHRNRLLERDSAERKAAWEADQAKQDQRWTELNQPVAVLGTVPQPEPEP